MEYVLINSPISKNRTIKPLNRWQKLHAQKKQAKLQDELSVEQLIELGFYSSQKKQQPFGVDVLIVESEQMDANWYELRTVKKCKIKLFPPTGSPLSRIQALNPNQDKESQGFYWSYQIYGAAVIWVALDLLARIIYLPCWDYCESIPLYWNLGSEKARGMLEKNIPLINKNAFNLSVPLPRVIEDSALEYLTERSITLRIQGNHKAVTNKAKVSFLRHHYTPYDYLWQTSKINREEAKEFCNKLIKEKYPHLFDNE